MKMTCAKPPLESSRGLFKASFELKYEVFVVFSRTSSISILLFALLLFISSKMFTDRYRFYSCKEISIVALFVSLNASIFLLSTSFRILFFPDLSVFPVRQFPCFLVTFQNFTLERPSVFHMHRGFNENLHAGYATSLHDET